MGGPSVVNIPRLFNKTDLIDYYYLDNNFSKLSMVDS